MLTSLALAAVAQARPTHRVFGYAYAGDDTSSWNWDLLTDVAFVDEPMHTDGTMPTTSWSGPGKKMIATAHAHGVRCVLTVQLFNTSAGEIHAFLSSPAAVSAGTRAIVDAVTAEGGDGVDLDFEFVARADKALFVGFVQGLSTALHAAIPGSDVSVAMPGANYPGYDIGALAAAADTLMIMAYDFHYSGSDPGPVAPLTDSTEWGRGSQKSSIDLFVGAGADPAQLVIGIPLYGYDYHATSTAIPGTAVAGTSATAVTYRSAETQAAMYGRQWDAASSTPYYLYVDSSGGTRQAFYDDAQSVGLKIDQAVANQLGGIGLWELSYVSPSFWTVLEAKLGAGPGADAGVPQPDASGGADAAPSPTAGENGGVTGGCVIAARNGGPTSGWLGLGLVGALGMALTRGAAARPRRGARRRSGWS